MKIKITLLIVLVSILSLALAACGNTSPAPEAVVKAFYAEYLGYAGNLLVDHAYRSSQYLSPDFIAFLDDFTEDGMAYDPVLCAQDKPTSVTAGQVQVSGNRATVDVTTSFENHAFTVELSRIKNAWMIDNVICK